MHVREFYTAAGGEEKPGSKGINLNPEAVATLREHVQVHSPFRSLLLFVHVL
jgi:hypothetical protein